MQQVGVEMRGERMTKRGIEMDDADVPGAGCISDEAINGGSDLRFVAAGQERDVQADVGLRSGETEGDARRATRVGVERANEVDDSHVHRGVEGHPFPYSH